MEHRMFLCCVGVTFTTENGNKNINFVATFTTPSNQYLADKILHGWSKYTKLFYCDTGFTTQMTRNCKT